MKPRRETPLFRCENDSPGESIAQRSRRPQRGMIGTEAVREAGPGDTTFSVRERLATGKHRTEVTEAAEGE